MDLLTHGFLPYAAFTWAGRPNRERVAAAVGGFAPDIDTLFAWAVRFDPHLYPLVHRGVSHTLMGAPVYALALFLLLGLPSFRRRWPRFEAFAPGRDVVIALVVGAMTHLVLDMTTITGVPLLWPFSFDRFTASWFFFSVPYLVVVSLILWIPILRGRATDRWVKTGSATLIALLVVVGGVRYVTYPHDATADDVVTPGTNDWTWIISRQGPERVDVEVRSWGHVSFTGSYNETNRGAASPAVEQCLADVGAIPWRWNQWGIPVVTSEPRREGGWNVTLRDSARLAIGSLGGLFGPEDDRALRCTVDEVGKVAVRRPSGFWG